MMNYLAEKYLAMVCEKCEKKGKLGKVITPDPWKAGASNTTKPGGRKVGENKLLTASKNRFNPLTTEFKKCRICKVRADCLFTVL